MFSTKQLIIQFCRLLVWFTYLLDAVRCSIAHGDAAALLNALQCWSDLVNCFHPKHPAPLHVHILWNEIVNAGLMGCSRVSQHMFSLLV